MWLFSGEKTSTVSTLLGQLLTLSDYMSEGL